MPPQDLEQQIKDGDAKVTKVEQPEQPAPPAPQAPEQIQVEVQLDPQVTVYNKDNLEAQKKNLEDQLNNINVLLAQFKGVK